MEKQEWEIWADGNVNPSECANTYVFGFSCMGVGTECYMFNLMF